VNITCGCGEEFEDGPKFGEHLRRPDGPCWDAVSLQVDWVHRDLRGNRINYGFANHRIMTMMKAAYEYGVTVGERERHATTRP
jgi:hypothetical protein